MPPTGPEFLRTWFDEVWNKGRAEAIDELASKDWVGHGLNLPDSPGLSYIDRFKLLYHDYRRAYPDASISVGCTLTEGNLVAAHCTLKATHTGDGFGLQATNRPIQFSGTVIARIENGKIAESWETWDFLGMYDQLGLRPS